MSRNSQLLEARDQRILDRYIYWTEERRVRFDDAIAILAGDEFFLSETSVMDIIRRLLREGRRASNGTKASKPKFIGFRVRPQQAKPSNVDERQMSLFD
jgi:hypothetical protein